MKGGLWRVLNHFCEFATDEQLAELVKGLPGGQVVWADAHASFWNKQRRRRLFKQLHAVIQQADQLELVAVLEGMALAGKHPDLPRDMAASAASAAHRGPAAKQRADEEYNLDGVDTHQAEGETDNVVTIKGEKGEISGLMDIDADAALALALTLVLNILRMVMGQAAKVQKEIVMFHQQRDDASVWHWRCFKVRGFVDSWRLGGADELEQARRNFLFAMVINSFLPNDHGPPVLKRGGKTLYGLLLEGARLFIGAWVQLWLSDDPVELRESVKRWLMAPPKAGSRLRKLGPEHISDHHVLLAEAQACGKHPDGTRVIPSVLATPEEQATYTKLAYRTVEGPEAEEQRAAAEARWMEFRLGVCEEVLIKVGGMEDVLPDVPAWRERYASVIAAIKAEELMAVKHLPRAKTLGLAVALLTRPDEAPKRGLPALFGCDTSVHAKHQLRSQSVLREAARGVLGMSAEEVDERAYNKRPEDILRDMRLSLDDVDDEGVREAADALLDRIGGCDKLLEVVQFSANMYGDTLAACLASLGMPADTPASRFVRAFPAIYFCNVKPWLRHQDAFKEFLVAEQGFSEEEMRRRTEIRTDEDVIADIHFYIRECEAAGKLAREDAQRCRVALTDVEKLEDVRIHKFQASTGLKGVLFLCSRETPSLKELDNTFGGGNRMFLKAMAAKWTKIRQNVTTLLDGVSKADLEKRLKISFGDFAGLLEGVAQLIDTKPGLSIVQRERCTQVLQRVEEHPNASIKLGKMPEAHTFAASLHYLCGGMNPTDAGKPFTAKGGSIKPLLNQPRFKFVVDAAIERLGLNRHSR